MMLRLVLVGLVAGLGMSLPSRHDLETLRRSALSWVDEQIAEDEAPPPVVAGPFVFVADEARATPTESAPAQEPEPVPVADAEAIAEDASSVAAPGPARVAEILAPPAAPTALDDALTAAPTEPAIEAVETGSTEVVQVAEIVADEMIGDEPAPDVEVVSTMPDDESAFEALDATPDVIGPAEVAETVDADRAFVAVVDEMAATFAADLAQAERREPEAVALARDTAEFESEGMDEDLYPGLAYVLNLEAEGLDLSMPEPPAAPDEVPVPVPTTDRLTRAVRLTREAVFAWASLLHGPAVVAISQ